MNTEDYIIIKIPKERIGRKARPIPSAEELSALYYNQHMRREDLAVHYGVSVATIGRWLKNRGLHKHVKATHSC